MLMYQSHSHGMFITLRSSTDGVDATSTSRGLSHSCAIIVCGRLRHPTRAFKSFEAELVNRSASLATLTCKATRATSNMSLASE